MIIFIILLFFTNCNAKGRYECGPHGNFEYCIEGFPGCVVGCHCYPGYYFDTDTKICEPNIKLTQDFRRHYAPPQPQHTQPPFGQSDAPTEPPPPTTAHALEAHVDEIAKDTGDLSDWLYNQFFKTIENQVINKTDDDELLKETRRSGGGTKRKYSKNNKKKNFKKSTKRGLRRKLLRISEDDSMFDSSSSDSDSHDSSGSWESWEEDMGKARGHDRDPNKDHGHRKIVVYSKQPKPPLPSFIFLPNVETPFYPPIGLPVPPMPMYPMIPVPPIQPFIVPPENNCTGNESTPTTQGPATTTKTETTVVTTTKEDSKTTSPEDETEKPSTSGDTTTSVEGTTAPTMRTPLQNQSRKKLLQRLKDRNNKQQIIKRMGTPIGRPGRTKINHFIDASQDPTMFNSDIFLQQPIQEELRGQEKENLHPYDDDVDFKYLTQLIHRVDANQTKSLPTVPFTPNKPGSIKDTEAPAMYRKLKRPSVTPGRLQAGPLTRRRLNDCSQPEENYYSNLGKQIATLIRGIHPDVVSEVNIDFARTNSKTEPFLSENSFAPRSYWERFVRSPLRQDLGHFSKYKDLRVSNEQLFDLESKVELAASSQPILTLQELENVISAMNKVKEKVQNRQFKQDYFKPSKSSLNVSLLPRDRSKQTEVPKKLTREIIIDTPFNVDSRKILDKKGVLSRDSGRNNPTNNNAKADVIQSNLTKNNELFKEHKLNDDIFFKIPRKKLRIISTITPARNPPSTRLPKPKNRPDRVHFNRNKVDKINGYYFDDIHTAPNLKTEPKKPNAFYIKSKPASYFFNEFDFFVK